ncbi:pentapeptide repeat-containing protein [Stakelama tenebrarum]|uniref:Membrane-associated oxidoreductase n=1 Tax=Stakelama tenebrarum TaxID=2711215 RepID=A0A6G6Y4W1_9SPHN|nr:pentapeptide repeat-containing protein [Sphingosinithalassobacter tenebrarum]QIG79758.1 hypothetical protein G5C33_08100 [Sphingosinithalassobacter tenebrarum]
MEGLKRAISAAEFKERLGRKALDELERVTVTGEVSFAGNEWPGRLQLLNVTFEGPVDLSNARIRGSLDLAGCVFLRTLRLDNCRIDGNLVLDKVEVHALGRLAPSGYDWKVVDQQLSAEAIHVGGMLKAVSLRVHGSASFASASVNGSIHLRGAQIFGMLDCANLHCDGDVIFANRSDARERSLTFVRGNLEMQNARIAGNIAFEGLQVLRNCLMWSIDVGGNIFISGAVQEYDGEKWGEPTRIGGDLNLAASDVRGHVQLESTILSGALQLFSSSATQLAITIGSESNWGAGAFSLKAAAIDAGGATIKRGASLNDVEITGNHQDSGISFRNATMGSHLNFWSGLLDGSGTRVVGDIDCRSADIGGDCQLTNVLADGAVSLDDATIAGDVLCRSAVSLLDDAIKREAGVEKVRSLLQRARAERAEDAGPNTSVRQFSMSMVEVSNDIDLSGLVLRATGEEIEEGHNYGRLTADDCSVTGEFLLAREVTWRDECFRREAEIPGSAHLRGSTINTLVVADGSFQSRKADPERSGLCLDGCRIDEMIFLGLNGHRGFPVPLTLSDIDVRIWRLGETDAKRLKLYRALLNSDPQFRSSSYLSIEQFLRKGGYEDAADGIYRSMMRRGYRARRASQRFGPSWVLRWLFSPFRALLWDLGIGYGTAPTRLLVPILALFAIGFTGVYTDARNFSPTLLEEIKQHGGEVSDVPRQWNGWDAASIGLRTHIPLIGLGVRDEWELADDGDRPLYLWQQRIEAMRPEDFGLLMILLNFALWPPLLAFALRRVFRQAS